MSEAHKAIVQNSLKTWHFRGAAWSRWCVPWAAILHARIGQTEAAVNWLHYYWKDIFTNEGRGTLPNANTNGHSTIGQPIWSKLPENTPNREVMQVLEHLSGI